MEVPVERKYPWIKSAQIHDGSSRQAVVIHSEGTNLEIILQVGVPCVDSFKFSMLIIEISIDSNRLNSFEKD